jgi:Antitoxin VbhA
MAPATRAEAAANAIGSVRAEGLDPGRAEPLLAAWARGELTDEQLVQARLKLLGDRSLTVEELLPDARAA